MEIPIGSTVGGYRIEQKLGEGGMGAVYRARHRSLPKDVALKVLWPSYLRIPQFRERFEQEADVLCRLEHPNVVTVLDKGEDGELLWIAMQFVDGVDLHAALAQRGAFAPEQAVAIVAEVGRALDHAHERGLLHRDVKPANILLKRATGEAMLTDFGIAKDVAVASPLTQAGQVLGTFAYSAPEQLNGGPTEARADVYSLGAVLFELLAGRPAFPQQDQYQLLAAVSLGAAPDLRSVRADVPPALAEVVARALARDPAQRYPSGAALAEAARTALLPRPAAPPTVTGAGHRPPDDVGTAAQTRPGPPPAPPRRRRAPLWIAAAVAVVVAAIVLGVVLTAGDGTGGGTGDTGGGGPAATGSSSAGTSSAASGPSLVVGDCIDGGGAETACDGPHAAEVYSGAECSAGQLLAYLGGREGADVLRSDLALGQTGTPGGTVCTVGRSGETLDASNAGLLGSPAGDVWRRCQDANEREVACSQPHTAEFVFVQAQSTDPLNCTARASDYLGTPFAQHSDDLKVSGSGSSCLIAVRGHNLLTASLRNLGSNALPLEAAPN